MRTPGRNLRILAIAAAVTLAAPSWAGYHYVHYPTRPAGTAPYNPVYEKFNLSALTNNTVTFFVSDQSPAVYAANDSFGSVLAQVKQAAAAWNSVPNSELRVAFGGLEVQNQSSNTAGGDVVFTDLA